MLKTRYFKGKRFTAIASTSGSDLPSIKIGQQGKRYISPTDPPVPDSGLPKITINQQVVKNIIVPSTSLELPKITIYQTAKRDGGSAIADTDPYWDDVAFIITGNQPTGSIPINYQNKRLSYENESVLLTSASQQLFGKNTVLSFSNFPNGLTTKLTSSLNLYQKSFTVEGWFFLSNYNSSSTVVLNLANNIVVPSGTDIRLQVLVSTSGNILLTTRPNGTLRINFTGSVVSLNAWHYFSVSFDYITSIYYFFLDGVLIYSTTDATAWGNASKCLHLGSPWATGSFSVFTLLGFFGPTRVTLACRYTNTNPPVTPINSFPVSV